MSELSGHPEVAPFLDAEEGEASLAGKVLTAAASAGNHDVVSFLIGL